MRLFGKQKNKKSYGLDVGNGTIKLVELEHELARQHTVLTRYSVRSTPPHSLANGIVQDPSPLRACLRTLLDEFECRSLPVATVLTGQNLIVRQVEVPCMPAAEFRRVLHWQADSYFGIPAANLAFDFQVVRQLPGNKMQVFLVGSPKQPILDFAELLQEVGFNVKRVDIQPLAALRSLRLSGALADTTFAEATVVLDLGAGTSNLSIFRGDDLQLVRVIGIAGNDFTRAIAQGRNISWEEAEVQKRRFGVLEGTAVYPYLQASWQALLQQVNITLEYYQGENPAAPVSRLLIIGGNSKLPGLVDSLAVSVHELFQRLNLAQPQVAQGNPCSSLPLAAGLDAREQGPILAVAIGLAMGEVMTHVAR